MAKHDENTSAKTEVPSHIPLRSSSNENLWRCLEREFSELRDLVESCRLETLEEAIGEPIFADKNKRTVWKDKAPQWFDPDLGRDVRSWQLIPFVEGIDPVRLQEQMDVARSLIPVLEEQFASKAVTAKLLLDWGAFSAAAGAVRLLYFSDSTPGHRRKGSVGGSDSLDLHRRWFSYYFLQAHTRQKRMPETFRLMERFINAIIAGSVEGSVTESAEWFERFLNLEGERESNPNYEKLTGAFRGLTIPKMRRLASEDATGLPPLNWKFPTS